MSLFGTAKDIAPMTTGTDVLRAALLARAHRGGYLAILARELNVGIGALDEFAHGKGKLPDAILNGLAQDIFGSNCSFDSERNLLVQAKQVPLPSAVRPPLFVPTPKVYPLVSPLISSNPQPQAQPKQTRAGWAE